MFILGEFLIREVRRKTGIGSSVEKRLKFRDRFILHMADQVFHICDAASDFPIGAFANADFRVVPGTSFPNV